tara:strand:+ start:3198 stop:3689 length:492 start_codon:yes stop_codon:yes gene_type:complete
LTSIDNPISSDFKRNVLKMRMNDIVEIALVHKPTSIYRQYKDDEEKTIDILMLMLIQFQDFYNCKRTMNKEQLMEVAYLICESFRHFNNYDIAMCLKHAKTSEKLYDRIDGGMIMEWLTRYDIERTGMIVTKREQSKAQQNAEWSALGERSSVQKLKEFLKNE